ncbi:hypothetical protein FQR65_LT14874 [Abscondita terminalis]|nr:hypothetical protein FQR65_LT14874 [Abscondita terminalis]
MQLPSSELAIRIHNEWKKRFEQVLASSPVGSTVRQLIDLDGAQLYRYFEARQSPDAWVTGSLVLPRGRGLNLQLEVPDVRAARDRLSQQGVEAFRDLNESWYDTPDGSEGQLEYLVQDPDGYLIRLVEVL